MKNQKIKMKGIEKILFFSVSLFIHLLFFVSFSNLPTNTQKNKQKVFALKIKREINEINEKRLINSKAKKSLNIYKISKKNVANRKLKKKFYKKIRKKNNKEKSLAIKTVASKDFKFKKNKKFEIAKIIKNTEIRKPIGSLPKTENHKNEKSTIPTKRNKHKNRNSLKKTHVKKKSKGRTRVEKKIKRENKSDKPTIKTVFITNKKREIIFTKKSNKSSLEAIKRKISQRIQEKQIYLYPPIAIRNGIQGVAIIAFKIQPNGNLQKISIRKSSGNTFLDRASLEAVSSAIPFPYLKDPLNISVKWKLEN